MIDFERENKKITSSLGANIKPIGFLRYRVFELIKKIFEFAYT